MLVCWLLGSWLASCLLACLLAYLVASFLASQLLACLLIWLLGVTATVWTDSLVTIIIIVIIIFGGGGRGGRIKTFLLLVVWSRMTTEKQLISLALLPGECTARSRIERDSTMENNLLNKQS